MQKINLEGLNEYVAYEKLDNNLDVYVYRKKDFHSFYAYYITNYGALNTEFVPINEEKMHKFPDGIAHFLEHKMFEKEDGHVLEKFPLIGGSSNAFTSYTHTVYQVSGTEKFYDNLNLLINFVEHPYFTDKNVEKEKGIIKQELFMGKDNPYRVFAFEKLKNLFINLGYGREIVGEEKDIDSITKEDLYKCYNTFYNPCNMCLIIVTNEEEEKVINFVKEIEEKRKVDIETDIEVKKINEPENVNKEFDVIYQNVSKCELSYSFKLPINDYKIPYHKLDLYLYIIFISNLGKLTGFGLDLKEKNLINGNIGIGTNKYMDYIVPSINVSTDYPEKIIDILDKKIKEFSLNEEYFNMIKKSMISDFVYCFTGVSNVMSYLFGSYANNKKILTTDFKDFQELNFEELKEVFNKLNLDNKSILIMKPLEEKE